MTKHMELLEILITNQIKLEKAENTNVHEALNLSYSLAQKKQKDQWTYQDADSHLQHLIEKFEKLKAEGRLGEGYEESESEVIENDPNLDVQKKKSTK